MIQMNPNLTKEIKVTLDDYVQYGLRKVLHLAKNSYITSKNILILSSYIKRCLRKLSLKDRTIYEMRKWLKENRTCRLSRSKCFDG